MYDLIIIGAGPSGIACGIEAQKAGFDYLIIEKGYLVNSLYNFPTNMTFFSTSHKLEIGEVPFISHTDKPTRKEALEYYRRIAEQYSLKIQYQSRVMDIHKEGNNFKIEIEGEDALDTRFVVVATGYYDHPRLLNIPGESLPKVKHYYDDAHPYIGRKIVVVGAANSACDVALETWQKGAEVTMVVRESELYQKVKYWILPNIENRIKEGSIKAYFNSNLKEVTDAAVIINTPDGEVKISNDYVLAMTGYKPDYTFLEQLGITFQDGKDKKPVCNPDTLESNIEGLYLAGVVISGLNTSALFIENTRDHGKIIVDQILSKTS